MSGATGRAAQTAADDAAILEYLAAAAALTVGDATAAGLAALERRARDLIGGNLASTPEGRGAAASYLGAIEAWSLRQGEPYIVSFAPRPTLYVDSRVARVRGFDAISRDVGYWQLDGEVLRSDLFAEVGRRLPGGVRLPEAAAAVARAPAHPIDARPMGDRSPRERLG